MSASANSPAASGLIPLGVPADLAERLLSAPISGVRWVPRSELQPNNYNPNKVAPPEMELLARSILEDGFTQPIVISRRIEEGGRVVDTIVDGFHRFTVSGWEKVAARYGGYVPVVILTPLDAAHQMMSTIRHNRARGTHGVLPMAEIVQQLIEDGVPVKEIMARLQMEKDEVVRLANRAGIPQNKLIIETEFSQSWEPSSE